MSLQFPDLCRQCGGICCHHPVRLTHREYDHICGIVGHVDAEESDGWYLFPECPLLSEKGCRVENPDERPVVCQLYPFVLLQVTAGWLILLAVQECPYWPLFGARYQEAEQILLRWRMEERNDT